MNQSTEAHGNVSNTLSVLIVSKPGDFRSSLATLINSLAQVRVTYLAEDFESVKDVLCQHQPEMVVLDGSYLNSGLEAMVDDIRSEAYGGFIVVIGEDQYTASTCEADAYILKGIRPERLLAEVENLLGSRDAQATAKHHDTDPMSLMLSGDYPESREED